MEWGGRWRHERAGLETPQQLLVVPTQALLFSALLLDGLVEVCVLLRQLSAGKKTKREVMLTLISKVDSESTYRRGRHKILNAEH